MEKIFRVTFTRQRNGDSDYQKIFGSDSVMGLYDGEMLVKNGKVIGYTHVGIITGDLNSITEDMADGYCEYPVGEKYLQDRTRINFLVNGGACVILSLVEIPYDYDREQKVILRAFEKSKILSEETQKCFKKFYLN